MSLCDKANCFFSLLFPIQIELSKSKGKPRATALNAARDTNSYLLPLCAPVFIRQMTLYMPVCCSMVHKCQDWEVHSDAWQTVRISSCNFSFLWNKAWLIEDLSVTVCYDLNKRTSCAVCRLFQRCENRRLNEFFFYASQQDETFTPAILAAVFKSIQCQMTIFELYFFGTYSNKWKYDIGNKNSVTPKTFLY